MPGQIQDGAKLHVCKCRRAKITRDENEPVYSVFNHYSYLFLKLSNRDSYEQLKWLPPRLPGSVRAVVATSSAHLPTLHRAKEHACFFLEIPSLKLSDAKEILSQYLMLYNKVRIIFLP